MNADDGRVGLIIHQRANYDHKFLLSTSPQHCTTHDTSRKGSAHHELVIELEILHEVHPPRVQSLTSLHFRSLQATSLASDAASQTHQSRCHSI